MIGALWTRRAAALGVAGLVGAPIQVLGQAQASDAARVEELAGRAMAEGLGEPRALDAGLPVFVGETVATGADSRLALGLGGTTLVRLGPLTRLKIDQFLLKSGAGLTLQSGSMTFDRPETERKTPVTVRGRFGLVAVRGTSFFLGPSRGVIGVFVQRGTVEVTAGGETVRLERGEGVDLSEARTTRSALVAPTSRPGKPTSWSADRIREALESVR
jgi:ferric-dicitrate binding protein FerR (iron transport regulator)